MAEFWMHGAQSLSRAHEGGAWITNDDDWTRLLTIPHGNVRARADVVPMTALQVRNTVSFENSAIKTYDVDLPEYSHAVLRAEAYADTASSEQWDASSTTTTSTRRSHVDKARAQSAAHDHRHDPRDGPKNENCGRGDGVIQIMLKRNHGNAGEGEGERYNSVWEIPSQAQAQVSVHDKRGHGSNVRNAENSAADEADGIVEGLRSLHVHHELAHEAANVRPMHAHTNVAVASIGIQKICLLQEQRGGVP
jgi:hypothetical protein